MIAILEKSDCCGLLLRPGPGDALRFCYAFSNLIKFRKPASPLILISEYVFQNMMDLICFSTVVGIVKSSESGNGYTHHITECNVNIVLVADPLFWIRTSPRPEQTYVTFESPFTEYLVDNSVSVLPTVPGCRFLLIDRIYSKLYMSGKFADFFTVDLPDRKFLTKVLVVIRLENVVPERNTPLKLFRDIVAYLMGRGAEVYFTGSEVEESDCLTEEEITFIDERDVRKFSGFPNYLKQMQFYAAEFDCVVGVNSGGLDLAVAGGLPAVRLGAFHHLLPKHGRNYNSFLSSAPIVNVGALSETCLDNITIDSFIDAFDVLERSLRQGSREIDIWL